MRSALRINAYLLAVFVFTLTSQFAQVMCNAALAHDLFTADSTAATTVRSAPTPIENVSGYILAVNKLLAFSAIVFDAGKVVAVGDAKDLRRRFTAAQIIDGNGGCLLPGLIDAHGPVFELGLNTVRI